MDTFIEVLGLEPMMERPRGLPEPGPEEIAAAQADTIRRQRINNRIEEVRLSHRSCIFQANGKSNKDTDCTV